MATFFQKKGVKFPRTAFLLSVALAIVLCWFGGLSVWSSLLMAVGQFLFMGGLQYCILAYHTLPRDLRLLSYGIKMTADRKRIAAENKMTYDILTETAGKYPNKPAIIEIGLDGKPDRTLTFKELEEYINQIANYFRSLGLKKGDCIALFLENSAESFAVYLGLEKIGVISALLNNNLRGASLTHCVNVVEAVGVIFTASLSQAVEEVLDEVDPKVKTMCYSVCGESSFSECKNLASVLEGVSKDPPPLRKDKSGKDTAAYIYTSGTTGLPKACKIPDNRLYPSSIYFIYAAKVTQRDVMYSILPLYHSHGLFHCGGVMMNAGCTLIIRRKFSAKNFWTDCAKYNCTMVCSIGELCRYLVAQPPKPTDEQHKVRVNFSVGLRKEIWIEFQRRFKVPLIFELYASTEGNMALINVGGKPGSVGCISPITPSSLNPHFLKLHKDTMDYIRDDKGFCVDCDFNEPGELVCEITKTAPFPGYRSDDNSQKKILTDVFKKGDLFYKTGDILKIDEYGWVYFCDRFGDTFRWKGENVSTAEVECHIGTVLEMTDVVVYGVEIPGVEGRAGMAAIAGTTDTIDLSTLPSLLRRSLPAYAVPLFVRLIKCADVTGTFKLQKVKLRNEGFDASRVSDPLFLLRGQSYVPLTEELHQELSAGNYKV